MRMHSSPLYAFLLLGVPVCLLAYQNDVRGKDPRKQEDRNDDLWQAYKDTFSKTYTANEERYRRQIWEDNVRYIQKHNVEFDLGRHSFTLGVNEYADWSPAEYRKYLLGFRPQNATVAGAARRHKADPRARLPDTVDWTKKGYVTEVKNQGQCGSCWAFSSTGSLEGQHFRVTGQLVSLSEQNLVDCTGPYGNAGCNGGWMNNAFHYVSDNNGIDTESGYPYQTETLTCRFSRSSVGATDRGFTNVEKGDEEALKSATATMGPISVAIDATHRSFQLYKSGVYDEPECSSKDTDHAVLVVGYGTHSGQDYWLVKNSWGQSWGMNGYIMMTRNKSNQCAIASFASYPIV